MHWGSLLVVLHKAAEIGMREKVEIICYLCKGDGTIAQQPLNLNDGNDYLCSKTLQLSIILQAEFWMNGGSIRPV